MSASDLTSHRIVVDSVKVHIRSCKSSDTISLFWAKPCSPRSKLPSRDEMAEVLEEGSDARPLSPVTAYSRRPNRDSRSSSVSNERFSIVARRDEVVLVMEAMDCYNNALRAARYAIGQGKLP